MPKMPKEAKIIHTEGGMSVVALPDPRKKYHTFSVEAMEANIRQARKNIEMFEKHIKEQEEVIADRQKLVDEGRERDAMIRKYENWLEENSGGSD